MNILLLGKPGSGKGTIAKELINENTIQLSTGDLLRKEIIKNTDLGKELGLILKDGGFASDEVIFKLVEEFLEENKDKSIIFDGFPRNLTQAIECINRNIYFDKIFEIDVSDEEIKHRIMNRRVHVASGRIYNLIFNPPINEGLDDITNEILIQRDDDREEVIPIRIKKYKELTLPIIEVLKNNNYKIIKINGEESSENQIKSVKEMLKSNNIKKNKPL